MPLYEYHCQECQSKIELLVRGSEQPACPECGGTRLEKLLSVPAAHSRDGLPMADSPPWSGPCGMGGCGRPECD